MMALFPKIENFLSTIDVETIATERKEILNPLVDYIQNKVDDNLEIRINFICTHNSRRSHLAQVWAQTMAYHFTIRNVNCYSGGSHRTALYPLVGKILENTGFQVKKISGVTNPIYSIKYAENEHPVIGFSKRFDDDFNPVSAFVAIMTCSQADGACPYIVGAENRFPVTFEDPKVYDHSPQEIEKYEERSWQIATELFYIFSRIES